MRADNNNNKKERKKASFNTFSFLLKKDSRTQAAVLLWQLYVAVGAIFAAARARCANTSPVYATNSHTQPTDVFLLCFALCPHSTSSLRLASPAKV